MQQWVPERHSLDFSIKLPILEKRREMKMTPKASSYGQKWCPKHILGFQNKSFWRSLANKPPLKKIAWERKIWGIMT